MQMDMIQYQFSGEIQLFSQQYDVEIHDTSLE